MLVTRNNPQLPQAGDTVSYHGKVCKVIAYDFHSDDLTIEENGQTVTINRLDID